MSPPQPLPPADVLLVESTYGTRRHPLEASQAAPAELARIVRETIHCGDQVLCPSFAVGRAQAPLLVLVLVLQRLKQAGEIPASLPIFVDSPIANLVTELYRQHRKLLRVLQREISALCHGVRLITTAAQSQRMAAPRYPSVIISASGVSKCARVLRHLQAMPPGEQNPRAMPMLTS
jgi:metallo-beta-lactamase family protein